MMGPCAKRRVRCVIKIHRAGSSFPVEYWGENLCRNPQSVCPRGPDGGYEKCRTACDQIGRAEEGAVAAAVSELADLQGSFAVLYRHTHACGNCKATPAAAGVRALTISNTEGL